MVYAYVRVSTEHQNLDNQKIEIKKYCDYHGIKEVIFIGEKISGTKEITDRKLGTLLKQLHEGDTLLITELSRLGRRITSIQKAVNYLLDNKIKCVAIKENLELGDNIMSQCLMFCFSMSAQIERDLLSERVKMGMERAKIEGKRIGRKVGEKPSKYKLDYKKDYIIGQINKNISLNAIARELNVSWQTLREFCLRNNIEYSNRSLKYTKRY